MSVEGEVNNMDYKEMKIRPINSKKDAIIFLNQMIVLTDKRMTRLKNAINDTEKLLRKYNEKNKIETAIYQSYAERIECLTMYLCNIFADETKNAASYRQFRKVIDKKYEKGNDEFKLEPLEKDILKSLDQMREQRNWGHHIPQSLLASQENFMVNEQNVSQELFDGLFSDYEVYVSIWEYHDIEWLVDLYVSSQSAYNDYRKIFQQMKKDYSYLIGKHMRVSRIKEPNPRPFRFTQISKDSLKANSKRR